MTAQTCAPSSGFFTAFPFDQGCPRTDYPWRQSGHFIGEPFQDSTAFQGENVRDPVIDRITVSFVGGWNLTFGTMPELRWMITGERSGFPPTGEWILIFRPR